jgi:hypothetical protein
LAKNSAERWNGGEPPLAACTPTNVVEVVEHVSHWRDPHDPHVDEVIACARKYVAAYRDSGGVSIFH